MAESREKTAYREKSDFSCIFLHLAFKKGRYSYERKAILRKKNDKTRKGSCPNTTLLKQKTTNEMMLSESHAEIISEDTTNQKTIDCPVEDTTTDKVNLNQAKHANFSTRFCTSENNLLFSFLSQSRTYLPTDCEKVSNKFLVLLVSLRYKIS